MALFHHPELYFSLQANKDPRYGVKIQPQEQGGYGFSLRFGTNFGMDLGFRIYNVHPSSLEGGFQYRGFFGFGPALGLFGRIPFPESSSAFRVFARFFPQFASYYFINTSFFFLGMETGFGLEIPLNERRNWLLFASVPVGINFRRDLSYSVTPGISVSFQHRLLPIHTPKQGGGEDD